MSPILSRQSVLDGSPRGGRQNESIQIAGSFSSGRAWGVVCSTLMVRADIKLGSPCLGFGIVFSPQAYEIQMYAGLVGKELALTTFQRRRSSRTIDGLNTCDLSVGIKRHNIAELG